MTDVLPDKRKFSKLEKHLLNDFQHQFPLTQTPYADIAQRLGVSEDDVLACMQGLSDEGLISRVGAVFSPNRIGASTLAAISVPEDRLVEVADIVSNYAEVNHNYEREHNYNLWFVVTAQDEKRLNEIIGDIEHQTGLGVLNLPLVRDFHIDLGFDLQWAKNDG